MSQTKKLRTEEVVGRVDIDEKIDEESKSSLSSKEENYDDIKLNLDKDKEDERQDGGAEQVNFNVYSISLYQHTQKDIKEIIKPCKIAVDDFELIITFLDKYNKDNEQILSQAQEPADKESIDDIYLKYKEEMALPHLEDKNMMTEENFTRILQYWYKKIKASGLHAMSHQFYIYEPQLFEGYIEEEEDDFAKDFVFIDKITDKNVKMENLKDRYKDEGGGIKTRGFRKLNNEELKIGSFNSTNLAT